jgi:succinate dehydrogenase / fumarate reductase iron-sulfur subunit
VSKINIVDMTFSVFRFDRSIDVLPSYKSYTIQVSSSDLMLDVLNKIKWDIDGSFSFRKSCRHGICGSCAIKVNGNSVLACKENVFDLVDKFGTQDFIIEPQSKKLAIKDLIIDKSDYWNKYNSIKPYISAEINESPKQESIMSPKQLDDLEESDLCIHCGACHYACPALEVNEDYLGPSILNAAYRYSADIRDDASEDRIKITNELGSGIWDCVKCFECQEACPKDVNPISKITKLHQMTFSKELEEDNVATRHAVGFKRSMKKHGFLDEGDLVKYSEGLLGTLKFVPTAISMFKKGKIVLPHNMPKSKNLDEVKKLIEISSESKFQGK